MHLKWPRKRLVMHTHDKCSWTRKVSTGEAFESLSCLGRESTDTILNVSDMKWEGLDSNLPGLAVRAFTMFTTFVWSKSARCRSVYWDSIVTYRRLIWLFSNNFNKSFRNKSRTVMTVSPPSGNCRSRLAITFIITVKQKVIWVHGAANTLQTVHIFHILEIGSQSVHSLKKRHSKRLWMYFQWHKTRHDCPPSAPLCKLTPYTRSSSVIPIEIAMMDGSCCNSPHLVGIMISTE